MSEPLAKISRLSSDNKIQACGTNSEPILDTRFQSFLRLYIFDLNNADPCDELNSNFQDQFSKKSVIRIGDLYVSKVCICGNIVNIYENTKYYRLKIDDSTGSINVTLWKDLIFNQDSLNLTNSSSHHNVQSQFSELYSQITSIQSRIKESSVNNLIQYEPKQEFENLSKKNEVVGAQHQKVDKENISKNENFLNFVLKKLVQMSESSMLDQSRKVDDASSDSCESFKLYRFVRSNCPNEFKCTDHKQVLEALKELESRGLVYSCEDEYHYLPLN
ncbi:hypothetical protein BpHYR1_004571 [Brachionus plicatilis]|uniref:CST complex subunit STN1 n=1 Tax=Brachionus plicatilis TaxID=10195 RepID=A0A3M7PSN4_BRAPC|nr:hypothetical protein BpHYR1_004571 [Brachionus plicatilis]